MPYEIRKIEGLLSLRKLALTAGLSYSRLHRAITERKLIDPPTVKVGRRLYYRQDELPTVIKQFMAMDRAANTNKGVK